MNYLDLHTIIQNIVGSRLTSVGRAFEMLMFDFEKYALHTQGLTRIVKYNDILVTTLDYQCWDGKVGENNDEWYNLNKFKQMIEGGTVVSININPLCDLTIELDNGITIQVFNQNGYAHYDEESEQYRFFEITDDDNEQANQPHYVVYSKHIEF